MDSSDLVSFEVPVTSLALILMMSLADLVACLALSGSMSLAIPVIGSAPPGSR